MSSGQGARCTIEVTPTKLFESTHTIIIEQERPGAIWQVVEIPDSRSRSSRAFSKLLPFLNKKLPQPIARADFNGPLPVTGRIIQILIHTQGKRSEHLASFVIRGSVREALSA